MDSQTRSPRVVGAHFFAKYGYDDALRHISGKLTANEDAVFWRKVVDVLDELHEDDMKGLHPCVALPPRPVADKTENRASQK